MSLDILGWGKIADFATSILNRVVADPQAKLDAQMKLLEMEQQGDFKQIDAQLEMMKAQTDINLADAQSGKFWQAGARPAVLWTCALGFLYQVVLWPFLTYASVNFWHLQEFPTLNNDVLTTTMWALLGLGAYRSVDKAVPHFTK
jgi:Holin of 3TMs, for gene-transfer release